MYDLPELRDANQAWWEAVARHARITTELCRPSDLLAHWQKSNLVLSQTCGYPLTHALAGRVRYLATPCYGAEGCSGSSYRSAVLVQETSPMRTFADAHDRTVAINGFDSQSGCNVLRIMAAQADPQRPFFGQVFVTGGHVASIAAVQHGQADLAAIDCVTLALLRQVRPDALMRLRVLAWSPAAPALPYITSLATTDDQSVRLIEALKAAVVDEETAEIRRRLLIDHVAVLSNAAYAVIPAMRIQAEQAGLTELDS